MLAAATGSLAFCGLALHVYNRNDTVPILWTSSVKIYLMLSMPIAWNETYYSTGIVFSDENDIRSALVATFLTVVVMSATANLTRKIGGPFLTKFGKILPEFTKQVQTTPWLLVGWTVSSCVIHAVLARQRSGGFALAAVADPLFPFCCLIWCVNTQKNEKNLYLPISVSTIAMIGVGLFTGLMENILMPLLMLMFGRIILSRRLGAQYMVVAVLAFAVLNPVKIAFRGTVDRNIEFEDVFAWYDVLQNGLDTRADSTSTNIARFNEIVIVADTIKRVPNEIDYVTGEPWRSIFIAYIPRILWPGKPDLRRIYESEWAISFGYMTPEEHEKTAANLPIVADGYWNFGWFGVVLVGMLIGIVIGATEVISPTNNMSRVAFGMTLVGKSHAHMALGNTVGHPIGIILGQSIAILTINTIAKVLPKRADFESVPRFEIFPNSNRRD
jgi:hypothetical protein